MGLRRKLQEIMDSRPNPDDCPALLATLSRAHPHSITALDSDMPEGCYTCIMYAFSFENYPEYRRIASCGIFAGAKFFHWLLDNNLLVELSSATAQPGCLTAYFDDGRFQHVGLLRADARIESKWGKQLLCHHELFEVPKSYGKAVRYYEALAPESALANFLRFAVEEGAHA
jgi:hypothetical protein